MSFNEDLAVYTETLRAEGWVIDEEGVYRRQGDVIKRASPIPILPTALLENIDSRTEKVELSFYKHGRWKRIVVPRSIIASNSAILKLADEGVEVNSDNAKELIKYLASVIASSLDVLPHKPAKSVLGWVDDEFLPYTDSVTFDGEDTFKFLYNAVSHKGKLNEWVDFIRPLRENIALRLTMATAFASPLIEVIGENPFVMHLWGGTGSGKTVALLVAMSIWGNPAMGQLVRTMNMTANSMLSTAAFLRNLPFAGDELQTIKSRWGNYDNLIMQITEGVDRGRMSYDKVNETKSWKCSFLFTGEEPCVKSASGGGAKNRVIEVECTEKVVANGNRVANFVKTHYGCAGQPFIEAAKNRDAVEMLYNDIFSEIMSTTDTTDKQAGAMALMLTADAMASELFFNGEKELSVKDVARFLSSEKEVDISERAYTYLCDTVAENAANFGSDSLKSWGVLDVNENAVYINRTVLERVLTDAGYDLGAVQNKWLDKGYLVRKDGRRISYIKRISGVPTSCLKLALPKGDVFEDYNGDEDPFGDGE